MEGKDHGSLYTQQVDRKLTFERTERPTPATDNSPQAGAPAANQP